MAPIKLLARLQEYADKIGESESEVIRKALREYMDAHEGARQTA